MRISTFLLLGLGMTLVFGPTAFASADLIGEWKLKNVLCSSGAKPELPQSDVINESSEQTVTFTENKRMIVATKSKFSMNSQKVDVETQKKEYLAVIEEASALEYAATMKMSKAEFDQTKAEFLKELKSKQNLFESLATGFECTTTEFADYEVQGSKLFLKNSRESTNCPLPSEMQTPESSEEEFKVTATTLSFLTKMPTDEDGICPKGDVATTQFERARE